MSPVRANDMPPGATLLAGPTRAKLKSGSIVKVWVVLLPDGRVGLGNGDVFRSLGEEAELTRLTVNAAEERGTAVLALEIAGRERRYTVTESAATVGKRLREEGFRVSTAKLPPRAVTAQATPVQVAEPVAVLAGARAGAGHPGPPPASNDPTMVSPRPPDGARPSPGATAADPVKAPRNRHESLAIAALVLGIVALPFSFVPILFAIAWILGAIGLVFGALAFATRKGKAGVILSVIAIGVGIWGLTIVVSAGHQLSRDLNCLGSSSSAGSGCPDATAAGTSGDTSNDGPIDHLSDYKITSCAVDDLGDYGARVTVTNTSSKTSDYAGTLAWESADGRQQLDTGDVVANDLGPGQSTTVTVDSFTAASSRAFTCKIVDSTRLASN